jgi:glutathione S-transferase
LSDRQWLEFDRPTIADIAVFPYIALARDGKIDLNCYSNVLTWIDRVRNLPGFITMSGISQSIAA